MNHPVLISILLAAAVLVVFGSCLGLLLMRSPLARLHYLGPASLLAPVFVAAAVLVSEGLGQAGLKAIMVALLLFFQGPIMTHVLGRSMSIRQGKAPDREGRY